jgi:formylglycine-generating enzyme required for sulfatase activity
MTILFRGCVTATILFTLLAFSSVCYSQQAEVLLGPKTIDVDLGDGVTMTLVLVPAGSFSMGSESHEYDKDEKPAHGVTLTKPFYLGKYEVTQEQWQAVMGSNPSNFKGEKLPVEQVSWNDCQEFLKKLQGKFPGLKFSLPTESQWEYACRAGSKTEYGFGDDAGRLGDHAWYGANSDSTTHDVGGKEPNAWGLYDMHGNVWEWCADWYGGYSAGTRKDPTGPSSGTVRVLRGSSWDGYDYDLRSASRLRDTPDGRDDSCGFRVAVGT